MKNTIQVHATYKSVDPEVEYLVHDRNDVIVAICAHKEDADILARVKGYGWTMDTSRHVGTHRVGEDLYRRLDAKERAELGMPLRNQYATA